MKLLRIILLGFAALAVLLLVAVALAFTPAVQTWAARTFAPATPELTVTLDRVSAGLNGARLEGVRVVQPGLVLTLPSADVELNVADAAGGKVAVRRLVAKGWILDLTAPKAPVAGANPPPPAPSGSVASGPGGSEAPARSPEVAAKEAFSGIFDLIQLPVDLAVDGVDLAGEVILPEGRVEVTITGGGLAAGKVGTFALGTRFTGADATTVVLNGDITAGMNSPRTFERFGFVAKVSAKGPQLPAGASTDLSVTAAREAQGEAYTLAVRSGSREVVSASVAVPAGAAPIIGSWSFDAVTADAMPFALGKLLPDFKAQGQGTFEADRMFSKIKTTGSLDASVDKLAVLKPELAVLGRLTLSAAFDAGLDGENARLSKLTVRVAGARPVLTVAALQSVEFNTRTRALAAANPSSELLTITIDGLPLAWTKPFLGDLALTGEDVRGAFAVSAKDGGFAVRPVAPVMLGDFSIAQGGRPLLSGLEITLGAEADYSPQGFNAAVKELSVRSGTATVLRLTAAASQTAGDKQPLTAAGNFEIDLPSALAQPVAAGAASLSRGAARGEFSATVAESTVATLTLQFINLVAGDAALTALPSVAMQARVAVDAAGRIDTSAPVIITQAGRRSDLTLGAILTPAGEAKTINVTVTSESLTIPDLQLFSALVPPAVAPTAPVSGAAAAPTVKSPPVATAATSSVAPAGPLWAGITGDVSLKFKKIVYSPGLEVNDTVTIIKIAPASAMLTNLHAIVSTGGKLNAVGGLTFDAKQKQPYGLKADLGVTDIDAASLLQALSPGEPSPVEGKFNLSTTVSGRAVEPAGFAETAIGDVVVTSKGGVFKALSVKTSSRVDNVSKVAALAGLFGTIAGSEITVKYAERARAAADVTKQFAAIPFDQLNLVAGRDAENNIALRNLSIFSPLMRLTGSGQISHQPGVPIMQQPLLVNLKIGARDQFADNLRILKLITARPDTTGYSALVEDVTLDGTLQSIGTSQLSNLINRALTN